MSRKDLNMLKKLKKQLLTAGLVTTLGLTGCNGANSNKEIELENVTESLLDGGEYLKLKEANSTPSYNKMLVDEEYLENIKDVAEESIVIEDNNSYFNSSYVVDSDRELYDVLLENIEIHEQFLANKILEYIYENELTNDIDSSFIGEYFNYSIGTGEVGTNLYVPILSDDGSIKKAYVSGVPGDYRENISILETKILFFEEMFSEEYDNVDASYRKTIKIGNLDSDTVLDTDERLNEVLYNNIKIHEQDLATAIMDDSNLEQDTNLNYSIQLTDRGYIVCNDFLCNDDQFRNSYVCDVPTKFLNDVEKINNKKDFYKDIFGQEYSNLDTIMVAKTKTRSK